jgi:hypothetical protein
MNLRSLAYEALSYIAPSGSPGNQATLELASAPQKERIAADLTATLQEIYEQAPALYRRTLGASLDAPQTVNVTVTSGSVNVTTGAAFVQGATIFLGGIHNQIFTENGQQRLLFPFAGSTATVSATLYSDCVALGDTVAQVLDEVFLADGLRLSPRHTRADLLGGLREFPDYGRRLHVAGSTPTKGRPRCYWVEDFLLTGGTDHAAQRRLRFMPLPDSAQQVSYDVRLRAPRFTAADLGTDEEDSTRTLVVANDYHESLVRPLFLKRWSGSPWFRDEAARQSLQEDAARARATLADFHSQQKRNRRLAAPL